jgi:hypothetical protein
MSKWRRLQGNNDLDFKGTWSESFLCVDCGFDTSPGNLNRAEAEQEAKRQVRSGKRKWSISVRHTTQSETFYVHDHVWKAAGMGPWGGVLCVGCLEQRIGRRLTPDDFDPDHPFSFLPGTPRLLERQGRDDPLGDFDDAGAMSWGLKEQHVIGARRCKTEGTVQ